MSGSFVLRKSSLFAIFSYDIRKIILGSLKDMDFMNQTNQMDHTHPMSPCMPHSPSADQKEECSWQTPGMAYVPWQNFTKVYDPKKALQAGTIFPELDKPFTGKCMMRQGGRCR